MQNSLTSTRSLVGLAVRTTVQKRRSQNRYFANPSQMMHQLTEQGPWLRWYSPSCRDAVELEAFLLARKGSQFVLLDQKWMRQTH